MRRLIVPAIAALLTFMVGSAVLLVWKHLNDNQTERVPTVCKIFISPPLEAPKSSYIPGDKLLIEEKLEAKIKASRRHQQRSF